jgi:hypothetical protein
MQDRAGRTVYARATAFAADRGGATPVGLVSDWATAAADLQGLAGAGQALAVLMLKQTQAKYLQHTRVSLPSCGGEHAVR